MEQKPSKPELAPPVARAKPDLTLPKTRSISRNAYTSRSKLLIAVTSTVLVTGVILVVVFLLELFTQPVQVPVTRTEASKPVERLTQLPESSGASSTAPKPAQPVVTAKTTATVEHKAPAVEQPKSKQDKAKGTHAEVTSRGAEHQPARDPTPTMKEPVPTHDYERAISAALEALERGDHISAQQSLELADRLRPNAPEVRSLTQKMQGVRQLSELERIRRSAAQHEDGERWEPALKAYEEALLIDKNATFAMRGKTRAERVLALKQQLEFYVANPDRLQSPGPLAHAREVLAAAAAIPNVGADFRASRDQLRSLIERSSSPRSVILRSDEATEVTMYQVGSLGRFRERHLTLPPGEYTAVGSRAGYRDARIRFRVSSDSKETIIEIRCEERI